jgi:hypothetical protein
MDALLDLVDETAAHPLTVHVNLSPPGKTISSLLRTNVPPYWCHHSEPLAIELPGFWRVSLRDPRVGQGLVGWLDKDGQRVAARLGVL